jgi:hypothetical protein
MIEELYLILHRVRGEPAFDIAQKLQIHSPAESYDEAYEEIWIIPTSGHRAYPYRWWPLEDLSDISDINSAGYHERPASLDHTVPANWPDHYPAARTAPARPRVGAPIDLSVLGLISSMEDE